MIQKILNFSKPILITVSIFTGFLGGVVFTVYNAPSLISQLEGSSTSNTTQADITRHLNHLLETVTQDENNAETWNQIANAYYDIQDYPKAIEAYLKLVTLVDDTSIIYQDLGVAYRRDNQFLQAIEAFENAVEQNPENLQALFNIGVVQYHDLNDEPAAVATWKKVAEMKPDFQLSTGQTIQQLLEKLK